MENQNTSSPINIQILTPSGFQSFDGIKRYWHDKYLKIIFEDNTTVECAFNHKFIINHNIVYAQFLNISDNIGKKIKEIIQVNSGDYFYDPVNVRNGRIYNHDNGLTSHNTFFGTGDTLINAETLMNFRAQPYLRLIEGNSVWIYEEPKKDHQYVMTVDVSKGRGQDYSTFNLIDISSRPFKQVAVYRNNLISPLLFPNIIYKYAKVYNEAWVVVESNDQGTIVCNGLYYDLEYENLFIESAVKSNRLGVEMNRKVKRIGCSGIKDLLEENKLEIVDHNTILECSTFVAKGQSYEASDGNHDDLIMNLVMFAYFATGNYFTQLTDVDIKNMMFEQKMKAIEDDVLPFGFIDDGIESAEFQEQQDEWQTNKRFQEWGSIY